jgi:hypothetical protein
MARFYSDENFPMPVVEALRQLGHDVLTIYEAGKANQRYPDDAILADARGDQRAVLAINRKHFKRLHNASATHSGIILCTYDPDFAGQAQRIDAICKTHGSLAGVMVRVIRPAV